MPLPIHDGCFYPCSNPLDTPMPCSYTAIKKEHTCPSSLRPDGSFALIEGDHCRIVAEGVYFANGPPLDHSKNFLHVARAMRRSIIRYRISAGGSLGSAEFDGSVPLFQQGFPNGIAFDETVNVRVTFLRWNAAGYVTPADELEMYIEDPERKIRHQPSNMRVGGEDCRTASAVWTARPFHFSGCRTQVCSWWVHQRLV